MESKSKVLERLVQRELKRVTHEAIVGYLSIGVFDNDALSSSYDEAFYRSLPKNKCQGKSKYDKMADCLMNDGKIIVNTKTSDGIVTLGKEDICRCMCKTIVDIFYQKEL